MSKNVGSMLPLDVGRAGIPAFELAFPQKKAKAALGECAGSSSNIQQYFYYHIVCTKLPMPVESHWSLLHRS